MAVPRDFLGQELAPGDLIVYPATGGRSTQMCLARIISCECVSHTEEQAFRLDAARPYDVYGPGSYQPITRTFGNAGPKTYNEWVRGPVIGVHYPTDEETHKLAGERGKLAGTLTKVKAQPLAINSRWQQHHGTLEDATPRPVTLTANARSVVKVSSLVPEEMLQPGQ